MTTKVEKEGKKAMAKKLRNAIKRIGGWMADVWNTSKMYITGGMFWITVFAAIVSIMLLIVSCLMDGYHTLHVYSLLGSCFCPLIAIPLGLLWKLSYD